MSRSFARPSPNLRNTPRGLPVSADVAYEAFCDLAASPLWVSVVRSVRIVDRDEAGRAIRAAFLARLQHATIGYTLGYHYEPAHGKLPASELCLFTRTYGEEVRFVLVNETKTYAIAVLADGRTIDGSFFHYADGSVCLA